MNPSPRHPNHRWQRGRRLLAALLLGLGMLPLAGIARATTPAGPPIRIAYVDWSSSVASANLVCAVLRHHLQRQCRLIEADAEGMWRLVADGEADVLLSAWLPDTHAEYLDRYGERLEDLGPNLTGTRIGLVIPATGVGRQTNALGARPRPTLAIDSIPELAAQTAAVDGRIVGIDPGAGIMAAAQRALQVYDLGELRLLEGSEREMTSALATAIAANRPIVVTGWEPHWMFGRWSLRFLDDPEGVFGGQGSIHTLVRAGLAAEEPAVYRFLGQFRWEPASMSQLLVWIEQAGARDPYVQALRWMQTHRRQVADWTR